MPKFLLTFAIFIVLPITAVNAGDLHHTSLSAANVQNYLTKCPHFPPDTNTMEEQIRQILPVRRRNTGVLELLALRWTYPIDFNGRISHVSLDHFELKNIHAVDLEALIKFTFYDSYKTKTQYKKSDTNKFFITRSCPSDSCYGYSDFNLRSVAKTPNDDCSDALCAFKSIFGDDKGIEYLWDYLVNGSILSPFTHRELDLEGFNKTNTTAILTAYNLVPEHLRKMTTHGREFYRVRNRNPFGQHANALGMVFDSIDSLNLEEMIYIFYHELGHRFRDKDKNKIDENLLWLNLTGWVKTGSGLFDWSNTKGGNFASEYARKNPWEDFAESFTLYRFDSQKLELPRFSGRV